MTDLAHMYQVRFGNSGLEKRRAVWEVLCKEFFNALMPPKAGKSTIDILGPSL